MNINEQKEILNGICPLYKVSRSKREVRHEFLKISKLKFKHIF